MAFVMLSVHNQMEAALMQQIIREFAKRQVGEGC
jgi:hypothetical protein